MSAATDIMALKQAVMAGKVPQSKPPETPKAPVQAKPIPRTVRFPVEIKSPHTQEIEVYNLSSTVHRDIDGSIDRMSRALAGAPLSDFLPHQQERFIQVARCIIQLDNFDLSKKLMSAEEAVKLEGHILDNPYVRVSIYGRLVEHHRRFRDGDQPPVQGSGEAGDGPAPGPVVVVGEFDAPPAHPGAAR